MAEVALIISGISGILGFAGAITQGNAEKEAGDFNAAIDEQNAALTELETAENERVFRINTRQQLGAMRASYGASGISSVEGSAAEVIRSSAAAAELDALKLRTEGLNRARAYRENARLSRYMGSVGQASSRLSAFAALAGAGGKIASEFGGGGSYQRGGNTSSTVNRKPF